MRRFAAALVAVVFFPLAHAGITLVDDAGQQHVFAQPVQRIVTLAPHLAEQVFEVGAGERLVGTVEWSNKPVAARDVPRIGDSFRVDAERIVALQPDIVLAWGGGTPQNTIERLRALQLHVAVLDPRDLESIPRHLEWLGKLTGNDGQAESVARAFRARLEAISDEFADAEPIRVFYQISSQPIFTVGAGHTISEMIELCGGNNIFSDLDARAHSVSREAVISRDPQVIIVGRYEGSEDERGDWRRWKNLTATRTNNLLLIDAETVARPAVGILDGARELCTALDSARENLRD